MKQIATVPQDCSVLMSSADPVMHTIRHMESGFLTPPVNCNPEIGQVRSRPVTQRRQTHLLRSEACAIRSSPARTSHKQPACSGIRLPGYESMLDMLAGTGGVAAFTFQSSSTDESVLDLPAGFEVLERHAVSILEHRRIRARPHDVAGVQFQKMFQSSSTDESVLDASVFR